MVPVIILPVLFNSPKRAATRTDLNWDPDLSTSNATLDQLQLVSHIGGVSRAIYSTGNLTYVGEGPGLNIFDTSDPSKPVRVGKIILPGLVYAIYVTDGLAYIATGEAGLQIVDTSDPAHLYVKSHFDTPGVAQDISITNGYAYIADGDGGVRIINIDNPAYPFEVSNLNPGSDARNIVVDGNYAYCLMGESTAVWGSFTVFDVSDPTSPEEIGTLISIPDMDGLAVLGDFAYIGSNQCGHFNCSPYLAVIDISDPSAPSLINQEEHIFVPYVTSLYVRYDPSLEKALAYIGSNYEMAIVDVTDPMDQVLLGSVIAPGLVWDISLVDERAFLASEGRGMSIVDISDPESLSVLGGYELPTFKINSVAVDGDLAYIAGGVKFPVGWVGSQASGYTIAIQTDDPAQLNEAGSLVTPGIANDITLAVMGSPGTLYGFLTSSAYLQGAFPAGGGMSIINLANPMNLTVVGYTNSDIMLTDFQATAISGTIAAIAGGDDGLQLIDISTLSTPVKIGGYRPPGYAWDVALFDHTAYIANGDQGMRIVDITDPGNPTEIDHVVSTGVSYGVSISGSDDDALVYLAAGTNGLHVFDRHPPLNEITSFDTTGQSMQTALDGSRVYIADGTGGLRLVDFTDLLNPQEIAFYDTAGNARDIDISNGKIYVADSEGGLLIFEVTQPPVLPESIFLPLMTHQASPYDCDGREGVYIYEHTYYRGECMRLTGDVSAFTALPVGNNSASSMRMVGIWQATLYEEENYTGAAITFTAGDSDFTNNPVGGGVSLNDWTSSIAVSRR